MIDFNKSVNLCKKVTSTLCATKKRTPKGQLTKQNKQFLKIIGLLK
jgi:hypothetical protein